ncbi:TPA: hypothetical protein ACOJM5_004046 [Pseudomonas putida]
MANTPVFTLGLGATVDKPVGAAFDSLHQWLERLRRQADGLRLGRIINEVIRLGLEQDKLQKTDLASYAQAHEHEAHIDRLRREGGEVERLRRLYQALAWQSGEAAHSPPRVEKTTSAASPGNSDHPARRPVPIHAPGSRQTEPPSLGSRGSASTKGLAVATGVTAAVGAAYVGHRLVKRSSPIARTRARTAVSDQLEMGEAAFILKTMDALGSAQDGKEAAEGVGGAVGELGGTLLGAALGGLVGKGKGAEYGSLLGGSFGEKLGNWVGSTAHELFAGPTPEASVTEGADHTVVEERGKPLSGGGLAQDRARIGETQAGESPAVLGTTHEQPSNRRASIADGNPRTSVEEPGAPTHLAATGRDQATVANGQASAEQAEGLGSVAGGLVGTLVGGAIGSVVPGFGTVVGSTVGGLLGEAVGGWIGRTWFAGDGESRTVSQQAGSNTASANVEGVAMSPATIASAPGKQTMETSTSEPRGKGAAINVLVKPAVVEAARQGLQTFASAEPRNEKADGYGRAAGGLVGTLLGGAVGSVVPLVGTTFGAALGGLVASQLGGWLGKIWFGGAEEARGATAVSSPTARERDASLSGSDTTSRDAQPMSSPLPSKPRGMAAAMKALAKPAILSATERTLETFASEKPGSEKAEGYGMAAGGLIGTLVGGAIGSVVPIIGTTFGAALGGLVGSQLGGWLGKSWFDSTVVKGEVAAEPSVPGQEAPDRKVAPGEVIRSIRREQPPSQNPGVPNPTAPATSAPVYNQQFTFTANMPVTVNNRLDDPLTLQHLEAIARRQLEELMRQARSVQLADTPHIAL